MNENFLKNWKGFNKKEKSLIVALIALLLFCKLPFLYTSAFQKRFIATYFLLQLYHEMRYQSHIIVLHDFEIPLSYHRFWSISYMFPISKTPAWTCVLRIKSSRPWELPPQPLTDPYVNLSIHTAPIVQPQASLPTANVRINTVTAFESHESSGLHGGVGF